MKKPFFRIILLFLLIFNISSVNFVFGATVDNNTESVMLAQISGAIKNIYEQVRNIFGFLQNIVEKEEKSLQAPLVSPSLPSEQTSQPTIPAKTSGVPPSTTENSEAEIKTQIKDKSTELQTLTNRILDLNRQFQDQTGLVSQKTLSAMLELARERKSKLIAVLDENPLFVLVSLMPGSVISKLPIQIQREFVEKEVSFKGILQIVPTASSRKFDYRILVGEKEIKFNPFGVMPKVSSGALVKVEGYEIGEDRVVALVDKNTFQIISETSSGLSSSQDSPVITALVGPTNLRIDEVGNWLVKAYHPQGAVLSYGVDWGDGTSGAVSDSPLFSRSLLKAGNYNVTFRAIGGGKTISEIIRLSVVDLTPRMNRPPKLARISDRQVSPGDIVRFTVNATDPDGDPISFRVSGIESLPGAAFNVRTKTFTWLVPDSLTSGIYEVSFDVSDGESIDRKTVSFSYGSGDTTINNPPYFDEIIDQVVRAGETLRFYINATDPDGDLISYGISGSLPSGANFDSNTHRFLWEIPSTLSPQNYSVVFRVSDGIFIEEQTVNIVVIAPSPTNKPPAFSSLMSTDIFVQEERSFIFYLVAFDPDIGDPLIYSVDSLPPGSNLNSQTGAFSWVPGYDQAGIYQINFSVADRLIGDPDRLSDSVRVVVTVNNTNRAPILNKIGNKQINALNTLTFKASASDPDNDLITFSASGLPTGAILDELTGGFSWRPQTVGVYKASISAVDHPSAGASLISSEEINISVLEGSDTQPPTISITSPIGGTTVTSTIPITANATDNIGVVGVQFKIDSVNYGSEDTVSPWSISWDTTSFSNGSHNITAKARDAAGNFTDSAVVTVIINNISDTQPPTISITSPIGGTT
ncbi:MAG: putative Ig domain-containing protein, partial [Patescibacteria group bacterium]|nr:putative Ig domain-containing protein [Patescibacteria group bacterium]